MFTKEDLKVVTLSGKAATIQFGCRASYVKWDDDDEYDCSCCIGGFSK